MKVQPIGAIMATNFKITHKDTNKEAKEYVMESAKEHKEEMRRIKNLESELKRHEKAPISKAHPKG